MQNMQPVQGWHIVRDGDTVLRDTTTKITSAKAAAEYIRPFVKNEEVEVGGLLLINVAAQVINGAPLIMGRGDLESVKFPPRECFRQMLQLEELPFAFVHFHTHPGGLPRASAADKAVAVLLYDCSLLMGIEMQDSMIITQESYYSLREQGNEPWGMSNRMAMLAGGVPMDYRPDSGVSEILGHSLRSDDPKTPFKSLDHYAEPNER